MDNLQSIVRKATSDSIFSEVQKSIDHSHFGFVAQGIFNRDGKRVKNELLARLYGTDGRILTPNIFIPVIWELWYETVFDYRVVEKAFATIAQQGGDENYTINVNPSTFENDSYFLFQIDRHAKQYGVDPKKVIFEILETESIHDYDRFNRILASLRSRGYRIAVDDFHPVGNHNMLCVWMLGKDQIDIVKFDGWYIDLMFEKREQVEFRKVFQETLDSIFNNHPDVSIVVEKIETEEMFHFFRDIDDKGRISFFQGYYFDRWTLLV